MFCEGEGTHLPFARALLQLKVGDGFGCRVNDTGQLTLRINSADAGVACDGLPTDQLLWGFVHIDSRVTAIASQYTSGECCHGDAFYTHGHLYYYVCE